MDERLNGLREKVAKKARLEALLPELEKQKSMLESVVCESERELERENADVEKLEKTTLTSLLARAMGKLDGKLDKERGEAYTAKLKYDAALSELGDIARRIEESEAELKSVRGVEAQYKNAVREKAEAIKSAGGESAERLVELEKRAVELAKSANELREAIEAGKRARSIVREAEYKLDHAYNAATRDLFGGGMISHISKHNALDEAQQLIECLQSQLRCFKAELADVNINADVKVNIEGFMRAADWFFDGFFVDMEVRNHIESARNKVSRIDDRLYNAISELETMLSRTASESETVRNSIELLAINN